MTEKATTVRKVYEVLRDKAIDFEFKPGERLNESALTRELGISRTPLREALNRLVAEGFLTLSPGQGFYCRKLVPERIAQLYQVRCGLETEAVRRAIEMASDQKLRTIETYLDATEKEYATCEDFGELARMDEEFHIELARLSGNEELIDLLTNVNERIRYVRTVNLRQLRSTGAKKEHEGLSAHRFIANAVIKRDAETAISALRQHIERRSEEVVELVRLAFSELYVPQA